MGTKKWEHRRSYDADVTIEQNAYSVDSYGDEYGDESGAEKPVEEEKQEEEKQEEEPKEEGE